ncbi:MAG: SRPBCC family protein, partial [Myxococcota bacterium]
MTSFKFTTPTPTSIRIARTFAAPVERVWRAHTEPELVKQWMTGPPGHSLPVCEIDLRVGGTARYVWKNPQFEMGMTAEFKEIVESERIVYSEVYDSWPEGSSTVTARFAEADGQTTLTVESEYPSQEARDAAVQPGFEDGYKASYETLDQLLIGDRGRSSAEVARPAAKTFELAIDISAPLDKVWDFMFSPDGYRQWTSVFVAGSYFEGSWSAGERIHLLAPGGSGMVAEIAANRTHELISIKHIGFVHNGVE